jgi:hypothetical protein
MVTVVRLIHEQTSNDMNPANMKLSRCPPHLYSMPDSLLLLF